MIDHTGVFATDFAKSKAFYDAAFAPLGAKLGCGEAGGGTRKRRIKPSGGFGRRDA